MWPLKWIRRGLISIHQQFERAITYFDYSIGSFGRVMLAKNKKSGEYFAMKRLKKADIIKLRQVDHVISENTILADIDHPFLVSQSNHY
jgi:serine/threonine protein kinase